MNKNMPYQIVFFTLMCCINGASHPKGSLYDLMEAISEKKLDRVTSLINEGVNVNDKAYKEGLTSLHTAVLAKSIESVQLLINAGANINIKNTKGGLSPLHMAVVTGETEITNQLIEAGADVDAKDDTGGTPLDHATVQGHTQLIELLMHADAKLYEKDSGTNSLFLAFNVPPVLNLLIKYGANIDGKSNAGMTPLCMATRNIASFEELLQAGASLANEDKNPTPLTEASREGSELVLHHLIKLGCDVNGNSEYQALMHAILGGHIQTAKILLDHQADTNIQRRGDEFSPLHLAVKLQSPEMVRLLIKYGAAPISKVKEQLITEAASAGTFDIVELIIKSIVDGALKKGTLDDHIEQILKIESTIFNTSDDKELINAVAHNQLGKVDSLIKRGAHVDAKNAWAWTLLRWAIRLGDVPLVELLIKSGANVNVKDKEGWTPLYWAAYWGHEAVVEALINAGAHVYAKGKNNLTPLHAAVRQGHIKVAELLIKAGANVNAEAFNRTLLPNSALHHFERLNKSGSINPKPILWTTLHWAAYENRPDMIDILAKAGADSNAQDANGATPLRIAITQGSVESATALINLGVSIDPTLLPLAAYLGQNKVVELLIKAGAEIRAQDENGLTALHSAVLTENNDLITFLLNVETSHDHVHLKTKNGRSPLHSAVARGSTTIVDQLIAAGADVNAVESENWTPLHWAVYRGHKHMIEKLIKANADITAKDKKGWTNLHIAALKGHDEIVRYLLATFDSNVRDNRGLTPLHYAIKMGHVTVAEILLNAHADVNTEDTRGSSPLHTAVKAENSSMIKYLITKKARINAKNKSGNTPLHLTVIGDLPDCADLLIQAGADINTQNNQGLSPLSLVLQKNPDKGLISKIWGFLSSLIGKKETKTIVDVILKASHDSSKHEL